jgi:hypothetical protein
MNNDTIKHYNKNPSFASRDVKKNKPSSIVPTSNKITRNDNSVVKVYDSHVPRRYGNKPSPGRDSSHNISHHEAEESGAEESRLEHRNVTII